MLPRIELLNEKKLVGMHLSMSFADYRIGELWKGFAPRRKEITNHISNDLISMVVYKPTHFADFKPTNEFERWAAVEVSDFNTLPTGMETFLLPGGLYAVFHYIGSSTDTSIFRYILGDWLPSSNYMLDDRPHYEVLGDKYKNNDPTSEEEIWIPVKPKNTTQHFV
ncbi:MAG: GyrI-like domain-containing protein [Cyclobacteriaceae bacterium]|nr:GyrI-like domain-containing protein [Cyclobacteriaceae bacterium]